MGGRASLIMVVGFAIIFGYINLNIAKLTSRAAESMIGYNQISASRNMASAGANVGLAMLTLNNYPHNGRILSNTNFTSGPFAGSGYLVRIDSVFNSGNPYLRLRSVSACTTYLFTTKERTNKLIINDTVEVRFDYMRDFSFSSFGWLSDQEGNVFFTQGDTLWGKIHSNSNIHINQAPVFWGLVTTSGRFDPRNNNGKFYGNKEQGVAEIPFPTDLSALKANATNKIVGLDGTTDTQTSELWVELKPGTSADDDGYAIVRTGSYGGTIVDSIKLSDNSNNVIYSTENIHVKGTLDGRLSIASNDDVRIEGNTVYERYPDTYHKDPGLNENYDPHNPQLELAQNQTKDMLGLVAKNDVIIPGTIDGNITIHGSIFATDGSFEAVDWNVGHNPTEWRINVIGSVCQKERGAVGQTNGNGFKKSYRFDPRFDEKLSAKPEFHPPSFPGYSKPSTLTVTNWWESSRVPLDVTIYY